jgi:hypothetical protein
MISTAFFERAYSTRIFSSIRSSSTSRVTCSGSTEGLKQTIQEKRREEDLLRGLQRRAWRWVALYASREEARNKSCRLKALTQHHKLSITYQLLVLLFFPSEGSSYYLFLHDITDEGNGHKSRLQIPIAYKIVLLLRKVISLGITAQRGRPNPSEFTLRLFHVHSI